MSILVNGRSVPTYKKNDKVYIEAKVGTEYEIEIVNNDFINKLAVISVDGLNVLNGEVAGEDGPGYVVNAYNKCIIKGFRYNSHVVGAFKFTEKQKSYASDVGGNAIDNCGVIGAIIFNEYYQNEIINDLVVMEDSNIFRRLDYTWNSNNTMTIDASSNFITKCLYTTDNTAQKATSVNNCSYSPKFDIGSTWGSSKKSEVVSTEFKRGSISKKFEIYYASREALLEAGIILPKKTLVSFPNSFPKFATPPKNWSPS